MKQINKGPYPKGVLGVSKRCMGSCAGSVNECMWMSRRDSVRDIQCARREELWRLRVGRVEFPSVPWKKEGPVPPSVQGRMFPAYRKRD